MSYERNWRPLPSTRRSAMQRIQAEYQEMPGMRLTSEQVSRLCGLERHATQDVLESLVEAGYLNRTDDGQYARPTDVSIGRSAPRQTEHWFRSRA